MTARGFTLIEAALAIAIIGLIITATGLLLARLPADGREVRDQDVALKIARDEIEGVRAGGYAALPATGAFTHTLLSSLASSSAQVSVSTYNAKTKQVQATVSWRGALGGTQSISLTTLVTQNSTLP